jgi:hypothetical protein
MIHGAHVILYSRGPEADRAFFRDVLGYPSVDAGHGWLIFELPPAEIAVHPSDENGTHELYLMCDDVAAFVTEMSDKGVTCSPVEEQRWGSITRLTLPGGSTLGVYEPKHPSPLVARVPKRPAAKKAVVKRKARKPAQAKKAPEKKKKRAARSRSH